MNTKHWTTAFCAAALLLVVTGGALGAEGSGKEGGDEEKPKVALGGKCSVCVVNSMNKDGKSEIKSTYKGYEYHFAGEEQKKMFDASPDTYAIQKDGACLVCKVDMDKDVKGDPKIYSVYNKKIYLFANDKAKKTFEKNPEKYTGEAKEGSKREEGGRGPREGS